MIRYLKKKIILILFNYFLLSCNPTIDKYIHNGEIENWTILSYEYFGEQHDVIKDYSFGSNFIMFEVNNRCSVPIIYNEGWRSKNRESKWFINEDLMELRIDSENLYLAGVYKICFSQNLEDKEQLLTLRSDSIQIVLKKFFPAKGKIKDSWKCGK